jgi:hypothetical protein
MATINGTSVGGMTLQIDYSYTQNTTANTTTVTAKLQLASHYALYASALGGSYISVGGSRSDYSASISYGGSGTTTTVLATKTVTISHNNDGTASCNLSGAFVMNGTYRNYSVGTMTVSSTITLPTIPRASGLTVPSSINTGSALSGTISPSSSSFNHKVEFKIGSTLMHTISLASGTNSFSVTVPHSWSAYNTSVTISVTLSTYNGSTFIASASKNVVANVPSSVTPSISSFTATIAANGLSGLYVQGKTTAKLSVSASAGDGADIASYLYSGPDVYVSTTSNNITTGSIQYSGTLTYTVQVTDTRGRSASALTQIYVHQYSIPAMGSVSVSRCDANGNLTESGTYAKYTINSTYADVGWKNTRTITVAYSSNNGVSYSSATTLQAASDTNSYKTGVYGGGVFALANTYLLKFTITDAYGATDFTTKPLLSAQRPINIRSNGKGVSIGGMSTKDGFECSFDADFNKNVNIDGKLTLTGGLSSALSIVNGGTGATTADGIAQSHYHAKISNATASGQSSGYLKIATIKIGGFYINQGMEIDFIRRGDQFVTTLSLVFHGTDNYDPPLALFTSRGSAIAWLHKASTGVWDVYAQKSGWDNMSVINIRKGGNNDSVTITPTDIFASSLPTGVIQSTVSDFIVESGTSSDWNYTKWNSGKSEAWRTIELGDVPLTSSLAGGVYSNTSYNGRGVTLPSGLFTAIPLAFANVYSNGYTICQVASANTTQLVYRLWSPYSATVSGTIVSLYVVGKWK